MNKPKRPNREHKLLITMRKLKKCGYRDPKLDSFTDVKSACTVWLHEKGLGGHPWANW